MIHEELCQHSASSTLVRPMQTVLQTVLSELGILLGRLDRLSFRENCEDLFFQTEFFSFLSENHAHYLSLDWIFFRSDSRMREGCTIHVLHYNDKFRLANIPCSCRNSGEASRPRSDLSPASDTSSVEARSSQVDARHLLEGETTGVASLLASIEALDS